MEGKWYVAVVILSYSDSGDGSGIISGGGGGSGRVLVVYSVS